MTFTPPPLPDSSYTGPSSGFQPAGPHQRGAPHLPPGRRGVHHPKAIREHLGALQLRLVWPR